VPISKATGSDIQGWSYTLKDPFKEIVVRGDDLEWEVVEAEKVRPDLQVKLEEYISPRLKATEVGTLGTVTKWLKEGEQIEDVTSVAGTMGEELSSTKHLKILWSSGAADCAERPPALTRPAL
jgi:hypothetical protein